MSNEDELMLIEFQERINHLEVLNKSLEAALLHKTEMLNALQGLLLMNNHVHKTQNKRTKSKRMDFYHMHKNDPEVIDAVKVNLMAAGYKLQDFKTLPKQLVRHETNKKYDSICNIALQE